MTATNTPTTKSADCREKVDRQVVSMFATFLQAYLECSNEVQTVIKDMAAVLNNPETDRDETEAAIDTIMEALFPARHNGKLGIDIRELDEIDEETKAAAAVADKEESDFAARLARVMQQKDMTQSQLAAAIGITQPAISQILNRNCRPQRRTIEKIAAALNVRPEDLWPKYGK